MKKTVMTMMMLICFASMFLRTGGISSFLVCGCFFLISLWRTNKKKGWCCVAADSSRQHPSFYLAAPDMADLNWHCFTFTGFQSLWKLLWKQFVFFMIPLANYSLQTLNQKKSFLAAKQVMWGKSSTSKVQGLVRRACLLFAYLSAGWDFHGS